MQLGLLASLVTQTRGDEPENAHSRSPAVQLQFTDQIVLILMILGIMQVIQILWYIYAQTYVWCRSSESRPAESTAGAATASSSETRPTASPFWVKWTTMSLLDAPAALEPKGLAAGLPLAVAASAVLEPKGLAAGRVSLPRYHTYVCA